MGVPRFLLLDRGARGGRWPVDFETEGASTGGVVNGLAPLAVGVVFEAEAAFSDRRVERLAGLGVVFLSKQIRKTTRAKFKIRR